MSTKLRRLQADVRKEMIENGHIPQYHFFRIGRNTVMNKCKKCHCQAVIFIDTLIGAGMAIERKCV